MRPDEIFPPWFYSKWSGVALLVVDAIFIAWNVWWCISESHHGNVLYAVVSLVIVVTLTPLSLVMMRIVRRDFKEGR